MSRREPSRPEAREPHAAAAPIDHDEELRALLEHVPALVLTVDLDGTILRVNRPHLGVRVEKIAGHSIFEYSSTPREQEKVRDAFTRAADTGEVVDYETSFEWPTGTTRTFACRFGPIVHDGRVTALLLIATDITDRRAVERTLQESEARFRRIVEQSPDIIFRLGVNGLEYLSPALETILGRRADDRMHTSGMVPEHVHPDDLARLSELIAQLDQGPIRFELRMQHV